MPDPTDLNWYEANGHNIAIRLCEIVSFVPGNCFVLVVLPRLHFIAPCGAAFAGFACWMFYAGLRRGTLAGVEVFCFNRTARIPFLYPLCT